LGITMLTVFLFGTAPAFYSTRLELVPALKEGRGMVAAPRRNRLSHSLIIGQVSLSLTLLVLAGLFLHSLMNLMTEDTGFDKQNVLVMSIDPGAAGYQVDARLENMMERVEEGVGSLPGIHRASFAFLVFGGGWTDPIAVPGRPKSDNDPDVDHNIVGPQYLDVMKTPIVLGRTLSARDNAASRRLAVINETAARTYFPGASPVGRSFSIGENPEWQNIEVIGVAKNAKYMSLKERRMPAAFYPRSQHGMFLYNFLARYTGDTTSLVPEIRRAVRAVDPNLPVDDVTKLVHLVDGSVLNQRLVAQLCTFFGILAAFLACIGIYGVVSYGIARRTSELGIRMALGAERRDVLWMVLWETLRLILIGVALGLAVALAASRMVESELFGLKSYDPLAIALAVTAMVAAASFAGYLPARRATGIDPMMALRYE
jgi:predicted permease